MVRVVSRRLSADFNADSALRAASAQQLSKTAAVLPCSPYVNYYNRTDTDQNRQSTRGRPHDTDDSHSEAKRARLELYPCMLYHKPLQLRFQRVQLARLRAGLDG